jgi:hypothetical protein
MPLAVPNEYRPIAQEIHEHGHPRIAIGDYVRKTEAAGFEGAGFEGAGFEGEVVAIYPSRKGVWMAVVEITGGPFAGMQDIYRLRQLFPATPYDWNPPPEPRP